MSVIVSVCVSMLVAQTKTLLNCRTDLGVVYQGDTDIVSVSVRSDKVRFFGFSSRQRTTRTRGEVTRYRKMDFARRRSGSGESWFDPRRGNSKRDITMSGVALRPFWTLFPGWSGEFCSRDRSNCRRHMMFRRLARWRPMRTTPAFKQANPGIPRRSGGMASRGRAVALAGLACLRSEEHTSELQSQS